MTTRRAQCSCGQLAAICAGEPVRVSVCHCLECKRRSGSAFSNNARGTMGPPSFEQVKFSLPAAGATATISLR